MSDWADLDDVRDLLTYGEITATSRPTSARVQTWLDNAEARIRRAFTVIGISTTFEVGSDEQRALQSIVAEAVSGMVRRAWASADGSGENDDGAADVEAFEEWLKDLQTRPAYWGEYFGGGSAPAEAKMLASYVTRNDDGVTRSSPGVGPVFQRGRENF